MSDELEDLYREVILDHTKRPRNFRAMADANRTADGHNRLCGDKLRLFVKVEDGIIKDLAFQGSGCSISTASASMMTEMLKGRTQEEAERLMQGFLHLVKGEDAGGLSEDDRERLDVMSGISEFPMRVKCATLAWHTYKNAVEEGAT
jgi:nitrogen fixation protein NifU and related proteins